MKNLPCTAPDFRLELSVLLKNRSSFIEEDSDRLSTDVTAVEYEQLTIDKLENPAAIEDMLTEYATHPQHQNTRIYLVNNNTHATYCTHTHTHEGRVER